MKKPKCGSDSDNTNYDFPLHVAAVFIVFLASIGGAGFPVVAKKVKWMKIPPKVFFFTKHFGTGVLIATAFVHVRTYSPFWNLQSLTVPASSNGLSVTQRSVPPRVVHREIPCLTRCYYDGLFVPALRS
jgi:hypothetical protein